MVKDLSILVVDDNTVFTASVESALHAQGYTHVRTASNSHQALDAIKEEVPGLVLLDLYLPGMDGLHLLPAIHKIDKAIPVMIISSEADEECIHAAATLGATDYLVKPFQLTTLFSAISRRCSNQP